MLIFTAASPSPPQLQIYIQERVNKQRASPQTVSIEWPDGTMLTLSLTNTRTWQKVVQPSKCNRPEDTIRLTFTPNKDTREHSTLGFGFQCKDFINNPTLFVFTQNNKGETRFFQMPAPSKSMKNAIDLLK